MICIMKTRLALAALLLPAVSLTAADDNAVANERPPLSRAALEQHWGVDCTALRARILAWADQPRASAAPSDWDQPLQLCAAIHNPPGEQGAPGCPDYAGAAVALRGDAARSLLLRLLHCS